MLLLVFFTLVLGGAVVSTAPTKLITHSIRLVYSVGALLALASGKAERRQVHPLIACVINLVGALETSAPPTSSCCKSTVKNGENETFVLVK